MEDGETIELGPTYKSLFLGACLVIGGAFGWWLTNFVASIDTYHRDINERLTKLEAGYAAGQGAAQYRDHKMDDHELRLRNLERKEH